MSGVELGKLLGGSNGGRGMNPLLEPSECLGSITEDLLLDEREEFPSSLLAL
jgi:hypothetical protein